MCLRTLGTQRNQALVSIFLILYIITENLRNDLSSHHQPNSRPNPITRARQWLDTGVLLEDGLGRSTPRLTQCELATSYVLQRL